MVEIYFEGILLNEKNSMACFIELPGHSPGRLYGGKADFCAASAQERNAAPPTGSRLCMDHRPLEMERNPLFLGVGTLGKETSGQNLDSRSLGKARQPLGVDSRTLALKINSRFPPALD